MVLKFLKIYNEQLSVELEQRGFYPVMLRDKEVVRYGKRGSPIAFQVGIEQDMTDTKEQGFNQIYLVLDYCLPPEFSTRIGEEIFPTSDLLFHFFRNSSLYHQNVGLEEEQCRGGKFNLVYQIGFEKENTSATQMQAVLRESIDYFCNYMTINAQMLLQTQSLRE